MKILTGSMRIEKLLTLAAITCGTAGLAVADAPRAGEATLKWTPHRASASPADGSPAAASRPAPAPQAAAAPPRLESVPGSAAATVQLPDGVPAIESPRGVVVTPPVQQPRTAAPTRSSRPTYEPAVVDPLRGMSVFRTPTRGTARPILGDESPATAASRPRGQVERLGGGLAPRFDGGRRPAQLTAGVDALPSVMKQSPAPSTPAAADPAAEAPETITTPAPREAAPSVVEGMPSDLEFGDPSGAETIMSGGPDGLMLGEYPPQLHVESFYDDPYACEEDDALCHHSGRFCSWLRQFGRPYYGWRWYRDFTAGAGPVAFTNGTDLGLNGNFGFNEYANQGVPFWNAFGVGWQVGVRGTQTNFQKATLQTPDGTALAKNGRQQVFVTTGFFTRAFEGRGLQGGAVYDYLHDDWFDDTDMAQLRYEVSYVWGYHEFGFWGASNVKDQISIFSRRNNQAMATTLDMYTGFYRLQFGDANEWKMWGGATGHGDGIIGSVLRAPMARNWALEGFFTYLIPSSSQTIDIDGQGTTHNLSPAAWNVGVNMVFYPGGRSRRSLASPYRPLFDVADNGTMIRRLDAVGP